MNLGAGETEVIFYLLPIIQHRFEMGADVVHCARKEGVFTAEA